VAHYLGASRSLTVKGDPRERARQQGVACAGVIAPHLRSVVQSRRSPPVGSGTPVPRYLVVGFTPPFGPNLRVRWVWNQGGLAAITTLTLAVSVYLVGRRH